jgi:uncharacterized protein (TIGR00251 family)
MDRNTPVAEWRGEDLLIRVRVQPRSSRNEVLCIENKRLRVKTTATPTDGNANEKVTRLLADYLHVPRSRVTLVRGHKHRDKQFLVTGPLDLSPELAADISR